MKAQIKMRVELVQMINRVTVWRSVNTKLESEIIMETMLLSQCASVPSIYIKYSTHNCSFVLILFRQIA